MFNHEAKYIFMKEKDGLIALLEVLKTGYWYHKKVSDLLKPFDISHEQYNVLRILQHGDPRPFSLKEIQSRLLNQTANTTRLVEKLRKKGYLTSKYSETNRRRLEIRITEKGGKLLTEILTPLMEMNDLVGSRITLSESKEMIDLLRRLRQ